jgi:hypothetical protein
MMDTTNYTKGHAMAHSTTYDIAHECVIDGLKFRASAWQDCHDGSTTSILSIAERAWYIHINATPDELRALAIALVDQAEAIDKATHTASSSELNFGGVAS